MHRILLSLHLCLLVQWTIAVSPRSTFSDEPSDQGVAIERAAFPIPTMTPLPDGPEPFEYIDVGPKIPNYIVGEKWGAQGEIKRLMQKPLAPEVSLSRYSVPEGFRLKLFASENDLGSKPIAMNWDHRGRLWLCETVDYPNELMPPEQGRDHIRICEDTNGDGVADKFTVFAENLSIPTAIEFYRDGVIVQAGVETLWLRDSDGDDRADERVVLITGWAMDDTHGGVSNFQYGLDNRYWAMQGYNNSRPKYAQGQHRGFRQGPFNFTLSGNNSPEVTDVEFIRSTTNNSWGLGISEEGLIFCSTANRAPSFFVPIPSRYYERVRGWTPSLMADAIADTHLFAPITNKIRQVDHHGGYTAGAGHAIYTARTYPRSWWNRVAFVCGPTGHLVGTFVLDRDGATYKSTSPFNLVASDDEWSAPIMAEVGPDGNVWIIDWYNYIVQHNPTPQGFENGKGNAYETDLRDKTHGRIYRLVYDGEKGEPGANRPPLLDANKPESCVAALRHSNRLWRRHAQRLLVERGQQDVASQLVALVQDPSVDSTGNNPGATHALWTLKGLELLDAPNGAAFDAAVVALKHPAPGVRRNAALVLPSDTTSTQALVASGLEHDADAQVRLGALMAIADMPPSETAGRWLVAWTSDPTVLADRYLREGTICAASVHGESFVTTILANAASDGLKPTPNELAEVLRAVAEHLARSETSGESLRGFIRYMASSNSSLALPIIDGLAAGWPRDRTIALNEETEKSLETLLQKMPPADRGPLIRLATNWGSQVVAGHLEDLTKGLVSKIQSSSEESASRVAAAEELIALAGASNSTITDLIDTLTPQTPPEVASGIVRSLSKASASNVADAVLGAWSKMTPSLRANAITVLFSRPTTTSRLLDAIADRTIAVSDLSLDHRQTLRTHPDRRIRERAGELLESAGVTVNADRQKVIDAYATAVHSSGDVARGKLLFTQHCAVCHKHSGQGTEVGPDLTGMAVHPKEELIVHLLDPNRSVEGNFRRYTVLTSEGQILSGMLAAESLTAIELIDAEGKRHSIVRDDIDELTSSNISLMPEGFEQQLPVAAMTDLLEFLTSKGRFVPLPVASVATAISTKGLFSDSDNGPDRMIFSDWNPKQFAGVPFQLTDPLGSSRPNVILLYGPLGSLPPTMPRSVTLPCNMKVKALHFLSGVSGWGFPYSNDRSTTMIVRIHYADKTTEDHPLLNGVHFADYIRRVDVPESQYAFSLGGQQIRYFAIQPKRNEAIANVELLKGPDGTSPIVMAVTAEQL